MDNRAVDYDNETVRLDDLILKIKLISTDVKKKLLYTCKHKLILHHTHFSGT